VLLRQSNNLPLNETFLLKELSWENSLLESLHFENFCLSCFCSYCKLIIFKIPGSGTGFKNTGFLPVRPKTNGQAAKIPAIWQPYMHLLCDNAHCIRILIMLCLYFTRYLCCWAVKKQNALFLSSERWNSYITLFLPKPVRKSPWSAFHLSLMLPQRTRKFRFIVFRRFLTFIPDISTHPLGMDLARSAWVPL